MKFSVFCIVAAGWASIGEAVMLQQAAQNTPAINIIDNARIMMLPGSVPGMGCGCSMAQVLSEKQDEFEDVLVQTGASVDSDAEEELLAQVTTLVGVEND